MNNALGPPLQIREVEPVLPYTDLQGAIPLMILQFRVDPF